MHTCFPKEQFLLTLQFRKLCYLWLNANHCVLPALDFLETPLGFSSLGQLLFAFSAPQFHHLKTKCIEILRFQVIECQGANFQSHNLSNISFNFARRR